MALSKPVQLSKEDRDYLARKRRASIAFACIGMVFLAMAAVLSTPTADNYMRDNHADMRDGVKAAIFFTPLGLGAFAMFISLSQFKLMSLRSWQASQRMQTRKPQTTAR